MDVPRVIPSSACSGAAVESFAEKDSFEMSPFPIPAEREREGKGRKEIFRNSVAHLF
jgi:hypothetical protein